MARPRTPIDPRDLFQQAVALHQGGRLSDAVAAYEQVIEVAPRHSTAYTNLAVALRKLGRPQAALERCDQALSINPNMPDAHACRGNILQDLGRFAEACQSLETAWRLRPSDPVLLNNLGNTLISLGQPDAALFRLDEALELRPDYAVAHFNRGIALTALDRPHEALASYDKAIALNPAHVEAHGNRGNLLMDLKRGDEGLESLKTALAHRPNDPALHNKLGNALMGLGRNEDALACFDAALSLEPDFADARLNRAQSLLALRRFSPGWRDYEARWRVASFVETSCGQVTPAIRRRLDLTLGIDDLVDRTVLVFGEQGIGDVVMFSSMLPDLINLAGQVSLVCEPRLRRLMSASFPTIRILTPEEGNAQASNFDRILAIGSLGRLFRNQPQDFTGRPFMTVPNAVRADWLERLGAPSARLRVGLSWRGGAPKTGGPDRSMALGDLRPLLNLADCEFVSLQYGDARPEIEEVNPSLQRPIRHFAPEQIQDFEDLAGLVQALDVVVSVQTALVHLAGAIGAPTLVMTRHTTPWRYGAEPSAMPWYRSVTLVRQDETRAWPPVVREVAVRLSRITRGGID